VTPALVQECEAPSADVSLSSLQHEMVDRSQSSPQSPSLDSDFAESSVTCRHPPVDVVSGYDRYYGVADLSTPLSRSFSSIFPPDGRTADVSDVSTVRRSSQTDVQFTTRYHASHSTETSSPRHGESIERCTSLSSLAVDRDRVFAVDQKAGLTSHAGPSARSHNVEVCRETTPSFKDVDSSVKVEEDEQSQTELIEPRLTELKFFRRQKFPVEVECVRQAEVVAGLLRRTDRDESLVNVLVPSVEHRTATDFMSKVLGMVESGQRSCVYDSLPEMLRLRLCARDGRHAVL